MCCTARQSLISVSPAPGAHPIGCWHYTYTVALCAGLYVSFFIGVTPAGLANFISVTIRVREHVNAFRQTDLSKGRSHIITWIRISPEVRAEVDIYRSSRLAYLHAWIWKLTRIRMLQQTYE